MITHLTTPAQLAGAEAAIEGDAYRHLFRARRLAVGERLRVVDGGGGARWGEVVQVDRRRAVVALGEPAPANEPAYRLELLVATPRPERAAWLVEKATELGVAAVRFLACEHAPRQVGEGRIDRLARVAAAALCQCHRSRLPALSGVHPWSEVPDLLAGLAELFVLDPAAPPSPAAGGPDAASGAVVIGPEGGFSAAESAALAALGARPVALGPRILRIETAALAAAARLLLPSW